ncbi:hypothetical protein [uncultured Methanobrevibacter sp.]|uniref:hypothetical protein n=1 Tax=uncultured Methanobrevibacter sp. TaxID=253161 RepID=UPI0026136216|nr:hypothetical protein [uncultured Methanobrevibacter sp.]
MDSFEFESGQILENVNVEYGVSGIPKYDENGNIVNAIVYCPNLYGGRSILAKHHDLIRNQDFDKNEFFFINIFSLGVPGSCSPSTTGLKYNFPSYTFKDRVNFKRQFLAEKFNIKNCLGLIGEGFGGFEVFTWACEYPDDMEFIIVLNSSFKTYAHRYIFVKCAESIIESSEDFYTDNYSSSFSMLSVALFRLLFAGYFPTNVVENLSNDEIDALMEDYVDDGLFIDIHDFKSRNDCMLKFDVEDKLHNVKAKSLILGVEGYLFFNPQKDTLPLADLINDSKVIVFPSKTENYYDEEDYSDMGFEIISFLKQFKNKKS